MNYLVIFCLFLIFFFLLFSAYLNRNKIKFFFLFFFCTVFFNKERRFTKLFLRKLGLEKKRELFYLVPFMWVCVLTNNRSGNLATILNIPNKGKAKHSLFLDLEKLFTKKCNLCFSVKSKLLFVYQINSKIATREAQTVVQFLLCEHLSRVPPFGTFYLLWFAPTNKKKKVLLKKEKKKERKLVELFSVWKKKSYLAKKPGSKKKKKVFRWRDKSKV